MFLVTKMQSARQSLLIEIILDTGPWLGSMLFPTLVRVNKMRSPVVASTPSNGVVFLLDMW